MIAWDDLELDGALRHDYRPPLRCDEPEAMLIYSVDGFIADDDVGMGDGSSAARH